MDENIVDPPPKYTGYDSPYDIFVTSNLPPLVTRTLWGALPPKKVRLHYCDDNEGVNRVAFNYNTSVEKCHTKEECIARVRELQTLHMEKLGYDDIAYNFLIGWDGNVYEGRGWGVLPQKELNLPFYAHDKVDFGFIGNCGSSDEIPPDFMALAYKMVNLGREKGYICHDTSIWGIKESPLERETEPKCDWV